MLIADHLYRSRDIAYLLSIHCHFYLIPQTMTTVNVSMKNFCQSLLSVKYSHSNVFSPPVDDLVGIFSATNDMLETAEDQDEMDEGDVDSVDSEGKEERERTSIHLSIYPHAFSFRSFHQMRMI
jgi:hypothetical protein